MVYQATTKLLGIASIIVISIAFVGCASSPGQNPVNSQKPAVVRLPPSQPAPSIGDKAALIAKQQVGVRYKYGGKDKRGFDCSGLVHYAYSALGKEMPRTTGQLWQQLTPVTVDKLQTGDVLFFRIESKIAHVGVYLGNGRFVHAPSSGRRVTTANLQTPFYRQALLRGGRP